MKISFTTTPRIGLGTGIQKVIHAGLNITPLPNEAREAIKRCGGCAKRAEALNRAVPNINPFASQMQPPPAAPKE